MEVCTLVFALELAAMLAVPFTGDGCDAAVVLGSLPPVGSGRRDRRFSKEMLDNALRGSKHSPEIQV